MNDFGLKVARAGLAGLAAAILGNVYGADQSRYTYERTMKGNVLARLVGEGIPTKGDAAAIIGRAQPCVIRNVTNGAVSSSGALNAFTGRDNTQSGGSPTIELVDPNGGRLIANAQVPFSYMLAGRIARARLIVEAKEDKFRVLIESPTILYDHRSRDASPLVVATGTGGEQAIQVLLFAADKISSCMLEAPDKNW